MKYGIKHKKTRLVNIMTFSAGPNLSRNKEKLPEDFSYNVASIEEDLSQSGGKSPESTGAPPGGYSTLEGDLIVGMIKGKAAVVSAVNAGKYLNSNFVKCSYDSNSLDPWFFCYWLNESQEALFQRCRTFGRAIFTQSSLELLEISLPDIKTQRAVGEIYKNSMRCQYLMDEKKRQFSMMMLQIIKNQLKGK
jgi:restriction endonuclease S subunit